MRHTSYRPGFAKAILLLSACMVSSSSLAALVTGAGLSHRSTSGCTTTLLRAVDVSVIAFRTYHRLFFAPTADVHPSVCQVLA